MTNRTSINTAIALSLFGLALLLPRPEGLQAPGLAATVPSVRLYVLDCGVLKRGEPTAYGLTRAQVGSNFSDACYLVAHPRGTLLWDVGIIPDDDIKPGGVEVQTPRGANVASRTLRSQLQQLGYVQKDITYLAISHGHADHIANANDYAGSTLLMQSAEWDSLFSDTARKQPLFATYSRLEGSKTIKRRATTCAGDGTVLLNAWARLATSRCSLAKTDRSC